MLRVTREGKRVEAQELVPRLGLWDEWSQWRNRLPPEGGGCACGKK